LSRAGGWAGALRAATHPPMRQTNPHADQLPATEPGAGAPQPGGRSCRVGCAPAPPRRHIPNPHPPAVTSGTAGGQRAGAVLTGEFAPLFAARLASCHAFGLETQTTFSPRKPTLTNFPRRNHAPLFHTPGPRLSGLNHPRYPETVSGTCGATISLYRSQTSYKPEPWFEFPQHSPRCRSVVCCPAPRRRHLTVSRGGWGKRAPLGAGAGRKDRGRAA
jgi:hypothetical protein